MVQQCRIDEAWIDDTSARLLRSAMKGRARRTLVGIAGIPGSGKSTLAGLLHRRLEGVEPGAAAVVPMDGFHFPNRVLVSRGLIERKGAPETFDAVGYIDLLERAAATAAVIHFPVYDRNVHEPVLRHDAAQSLGPATRVLIAEGNYLLLDRHPWDALAAVLDECWSLETPLETARQWTISRHVRGGRAPADATAHYGRCDGPNAQLVLSCARDPDLCLRWPDY